MKINAAMLASFGLVVLISSIGLANPDDQQEPGGRRRPGAGLADRPLSQDRGPQRGPEAGGRLGNDRANGPGSAQFVTMLMRQFDKDGDQKLNTDELTALLTSMRARQAQMGGQTPMGPMQGNRFRPGGLGGMEGRRGGADGNDEAGGVSPKRPPVEQ
jgi:hypothetical protein